MYGAPRTKKNSSRLVRPGQKGRARPIPSKAWETWLRVCEIQPLKVIRERIDYDVNCRARFYRDANRGDAVGYYQGLADLLEKKGILANDKHIVQWDGSRLRIDRENPRVEVTLERV